MFLIPTVNIFITGVLVWLLRGLICRSQHEADGKAVLVTGCDTGIGRWRTFGRLGKWDWPHIKPTDMPLVIYWKIKIGNSYLKLNVFVSILHYKIHYQQMLNYFFKKSLYDYLQVMRWPDTWMLWDALCLQDVITLLVREPRGSGLRLAPGWPLWTWMFLSLRWWTWLSGTIVHKFDTHDLSFIDGQNCLLSLKIDCI